MSEGQPLKIPRFLSCLVKGPLGCLSFAVGAGVVLVLCLPFACGRLVERTSERWFSDRHAGTLEIGDAWLGSLYGPQRIERVILRDPEGDEVLRGDLSAPSLSQAFDGPVHRYGPVVLRIELMRLVESEDGSNNLERALREELNQGEGRSFRTDIPFEIEVRLVIERLRFSSAADGELALDDLVFNGTLEWGPDATHLALEGGSPTGDEDPLEARVDVQLVEFGSRRSWSSSLALERAPTALARALCAAVRPIASLAGARLDRLRWTQQGSEVLLRCEDEGALFELRGVEEDGVVVAAGDEALSASLPCSSQAGNDLLARLLPLVDSIACHDENSSPHQLALLNFRWPLEEDWRALSGDVEVRLAPASCELAPLFDGPDEVEFPDDSPARFAVKEGRLEYTAFRLPLEEGWLQVDGQVGLSNGESDLNVTGRIDGEFLSMRLRGRGDVLVPSPPSPPALPVPSPKAPSALPGD